jgi:hypothetical protein
VASVAVTEEAASPCRPESDFRAGRGSGTDNSLETILPRRRWRGTTIFTRRGFSAKDHGEAAAGRAVPPRRPCLFCSPSGRHGRGYLGWCPQSADPLQQSLEVNPRQVHDQVGKEAPAAAILAEQFALRGSPKVLPWNGPL